MREVMTPEQVAEYLQLNKDTVYRLIRSHQLAASKIGRAYRVPKKDVESFLLANSSRPAVRQVHFSRVLSIAERNPGVNSDDILDELEAMDEQEERQRASQG